MTTSGSDYYVHFGHERRCVEAWSAGALAFEGPGPVQHRTALRAALDTLPSSDFLEATYRGTDSGARQADLENILFYNVGCSAFTRFGTQTVRFERQAGALPEPPVPLPFVARHYVRYGVDGRGGPDAEPWLVATSEILNCRRTEMSNPASLWRMFKSNLLRTNDVDLLDGAPFEVRLLLSGPMGRPLNLTAIVKPLMDGFISALHYYEGNQLDEIASRLAVQLSVRSDDVRAILVDRSSAVLGAYPVPHLRGNGLQWSPADHQLVAATITREISSSAHFGVKALLSRA